jgi:hypothetical protein
VADYKEFKSMEDFEMFDGTFESIKNNLFMRLFNKHNLPLNKDLETVPHVNYADLAITFSIEEKTYFNDNKGVYSYLITNEDMETLKVDISTLRRIATKNILDKNSVRIETISQHIARNHIFSPLTRIPSNINTMIQIDGGINTKRHSPFEGNEFGPLPITSNSEEDTKDVLLISNRTQTFASVNFVMPEVLEKVYNEFKENFYIIPSSIHEMICIKSSYATDNGNKTEKQALEDLEDMVEQINDVIHQDTLNILSYNIYYHIHDDNCTMIVT